MGKIRSHILEIEMKYHYRGAMQIWWHCNGVEPRVGPKKTYRSEAKNVGGKFKCVSEVHSTKDVAASHWSNICKN